MKRLNLVSISSSNVEEVEMNKSQKLAKQGYSREFQAMLDSLEEEDNYTDQEEAIHNCSSSEKKRRLSTHQVKALEKNFEVENKLESERKLKLAEELGLQPRQVAIWFQNRRARWKTKQLERDYTVLKANYDALQLDYTNLEQHNHSLTLQLKEVKAKIMGEEKAESSSHSVKEECPVSVSESDQNNVEVSDNNNCNSNSNGEINGENGYPLMNWIQLSESRTIMQVPLFQSQLVKLEEQSLFNISTEESCNFFSVDQPPTLHWQ